MQNSKQVLERTPARIGRSRRSPLWIAAVATIAAMAAHLYLASVHYDLLFGAPAGDRICNVGDLFNCEAVSASRWSEFAGVPMAIWGFAVNGAFLLLLAGYSIAEPDAKRARGISALAVAGLIFSASVVMGAISIVALSKYCLFCIFAYVCSLVAFITAWRGLAPELAQESRAERGLFNAVPAAWALGGALIAALLGNSMAKNAYGERNLAPLITSSVAEWLATPAVAISPAAPLIAGAPAETAKLTLVEFADFRCSHCKHAAPVLDAFVSSRSDVRLLFQPWPLDGACNPKIPTSYGASCLLARASYCASTNSQAYGWAAHKWIYDRQEQFSTNESTEKALEGLPVAIGLDEAKFKACVTSDAAKEMVSKQSAVGNALELGGTPTIFANGRRLPAGYSLPVLSAAYDSSASAAPVNRP